MNFGLTGIGIGGLFYIACAVVILIREGYRKVRTHFHKHPQQLLVDLGVILVGIVSTTILTDSGLDIIVNYARAHFNNSSALPSLIPSTGLTEVRSIVVSVGVLVSVLALTHFLRFFVSTNKERHETSELS